MLAALLTVPFGGSVTVKLPFKKVGGKKINSILSL